MGSASSVLLLIVTEYSSPRYRGIFLTLKSASFFWGIWTANAIGTFLNFRNIGLLGTVCSIYTLISVFIIPESPYWLASKGNFDECAKSHRWLKGIDKNMDKELEHLLNPQKANNRHIKKTVLDRFAVIVRNLSKPEVYKPVGLIILVNGLYDGSGKLVCTIYSIQIIKKITGSESTAYTGMLVLDGVTVLGMYVGCGLSKFLKRRTLLLTASLIATIFLYIICVYLYLIKFTFVSENNFVTIALLSCFSLAICCGPMILSTSIYGELIPIISRSFISGFLACYTSFMDGLILKLSPYIFQLLGFDGTFAFFAIISTILIVLVYTFLPETKDKTLLEIADLFTPKTSTEAIELECLD